MPARRLDDGSEFPVELTIVRDRRAGAGPTVFARDVSHRAELERTRAHMEQVVAGTQDAVLSKDLDGVVTTWNPAAERLYGYSAEEAVGQHVSFLMPDELKHEVEAILARVRRGEQLDTYETRRVRKDGTEIDVSLTISPIGSPGGRLYGASVIARDITTERRRRRARDFLIAATRDLDASLDPTETARNIVAKAVPDAGRGLHHRLHPRGRADRRLGRRLGDPRRRRAARADPPRIAARPRGRPPGRPGAARRRADDLARPERARRWPSRSPRPRRTGS